MTGMYPTLAQAKDTKPEWAGAHYWIRHGGMVSCFFCGYLPRRDGTESKCKGPVKITLREEQDAGT